MSDSKSGLSNIGDVSLDKSVLDLCQQFSDEVKSLPIDFFYRRSMYMVIQYRHSFGDSVSLVFLNNLKQSCSEWNVEIEKGMYVHDVASVIMGATFKKWLKAILEKNEAQAEKLMDKVSSCLFDKFSLRSISYILPAEEIAERVFDEIAEHDPATAMKTSYVSRCAKMITRVNRNYENGDIVLVSPEECAVCLADLVDESIQEEIDYYQKSKNDGVLTEDEAKQGVANMLKLEKKAKLRRAEIPEVRKEGETGMQDVAIGVQGSDVSSEALSTANLSMNQEPYSSSIEGERKTRRYVLHDGTQKEATEEQYTTLSREKESGVYLLADSSPEEILEAQARRFGRAETTNLLSINRKKREARFRGSNGERYNTSKTSCECMDFRFRGMPCKHIYRLWLELGLAIGEDYSLQEEKADSPASAAAIKPKKGFCGMCLLAFFVGLVSMLLFPVFIIAPIGIILGVKGRRKSTTLGLSGKWFGIVGIVLSLIGGGLSVIFLLSLMF